MIESYVLGMAGEQEAAELVKLSRQYPEIREAIDAFEAALEKAAVANAMPPPDTTKQKLFEILDASEARPAPVVAISRRFNLVKYIAAASIILLIASALLNVYFYTQFKSASAAYLALVVEKNTLLVENQHTQTKMLDMYQSMQLMSDPTVAKVPMPGVPGHESNLVTAFWDTKSKDVYVLLNQLPEAPTGKQYQLWAMVDNKPVDAGVIGSCAGLCKMKNIPKASLFAITLEDKGGSPTPHLDQLYVASKAI